MESFLRQRILFAARLMGRRAEASPSPLTPTRSTMSSGLSQRTCSSSSSYSMPSAPPPTSFRASTPQTTAMPLVARFVQGFGRDAIREGKLFEVFRPYGLRLRRRMPHRRRQGHWPSQGIRLRPLPYLRRSRQGSQAASAEDQRPRCLLSVIRRRCRLRPATSRRGRYT